MLELLTDKPKQEENAEEKRTGSIEKQVLLRCIRASGCGTFGLFCLFVIFAITSGILWFTNWWLARWSDSERSRYESINITSNCSSTGQPPNSSMSNEQRYKERNQYFYVLLGNYLHLHRT